MTNRLQWEVFISAQILVVTNNFPPNVSEVKESPHYLQEIRRIEKELVWRAVYARHTGSCSKAH